jgi:hypothetical protein
MPSAPRAAYCPTCQHRDERTGRCRDLPDTYTSQAPIVCTSYDGPPLEDTGSVRCTVCGQPTPPHPDGPQVPIACSVACYDRRHKEDT